MVGATRDLFSRNRVSSPASFISRCTTYTPSVLTEQEIHLDYESPVRPPRKFRAGPTLHRLAFWCIILNIAVAALIAGLLLRRFAWDQTEPIRFNADIDNAFVQGTLTLRQGYLARYTNQDTTTGDYEFDYAPGRLMIATLWTKWVRSAVDGPSDPQFVTEWPRSFYATVRSMDPRPEWGKVSSSAYYLCRPLLILNTIGEIFSAVAMFLLVRQWTSGQPKPKILSWPQARPARSAILGLVAALFFWLNPAVIWNAHCWPQWDSWVFPFFLWALVSASADYWFCAGVLVAAGTMFKGQILFGAPLFILWPLWRGQWLAIVRWIIGVASATAAITAVWLLRSNDQLNTSAVLWITGTAIAVAALWWAIKPRFPRPVRIALAVVAFALVTWPLYRMGWMWIACALLALGALALLFHFGSRRAVPYAAGGFITAALFACVPVFNGSMAWFQVGIAYGTHRYNEMTRGTDNNLAAILETQWNWNLMDPVLTIPPGHVADWLGSHLSTADPYLQFEPHHPFDISLKYFLFTIYVIAMVLCSFGAAYHSKRGSPRFLVAVTAPWIVFFAVLTQMHQRYLLWGAGMSAATVALGPGFLLLHLLITAIAWSQEAVDMLGRGGYRDGTLFKIISGWNPGIGWALLLCAAIFVYVAVTPGTTRSR
jgi:hypothetical protein